MTKSTSYSINGLTDNLVQISKKYNINHNTLKSRLRKGLSIENAINTLNQRERKIYTINNFTGSLLEISKKFNINYGTLYDRLNIQNMSIEDAIEYPILNKMNQKLYTINKFIGSVKEISEEFKINHYTLKSRLRKGLVIKDAIKTEKQCEKVYTINGFTGNMTNIAKKFNISYATLKNNLKNNIDIEDIINIENKIKIYTVNGFTGNLKQVSKKFNIPYSTIFYRINSKNMNLKDAIGLYNNRIISKSKIYTINEFTGTLKEIAEYFNINYTKLLYKLKVRNESIEDIIKEFLKSN